MSARCALGDPPGSCTAAAAVLVDGGVVAALACRAHGRAATRTAPGTVMRPLGTPAAAGPPLRGRPGRRGGAAVIVFPVRA